MNARHTTFHPKWHRERMPIFWWLRKWNYTKFITRELTSLAVAYTALLLVVEIACAARGEGPWSRLEAWLRSPAVLVFHGIVLLFLLVHSVTWLNLAPRAVSVRLAGRHVPDSLVLAGHYVAWLLASALVWWVLTGTGR